MMSRCTRRPTFAEAALSTTRIASAVLPDLPMTLPMSSRETRSSTTELEPSPANYSTSTVSGLSTSAFAIEATSSAKLG